jgi:hypothetical protein
MKQISVTAAMLLTFCLLPQRVVSFDIDQTVMNRASDSLELREFSAQSRREQERPRIRVRPREPMAYEFPRPNTYSWPGPGAVRQCVDWYATEYRPSGMVVTPQMRCRWVRRY